MNSGNKRPWQLIETLSKNPPLCNMKDLFHFSVPCLNSEGRVQHHDSIRDALDNVLIIVLEILDSPGVQGLLCRVFHDTEEPLVETKGIS